MRELTARVLASHALARSPQLRSFLKYILTASANGGAPPTEYEIGTHALGRPEDYSPNEDNIVRVQARMLRQKLEVYFAEEAPGEPVRIEIPKGSYAPRFVETSPAAGHMIEEAPSVERPAGECEIAGSGRWRRFWPWIGCAAVVLAVAVARYPGLPSSNLSHRFWSQVMPPGETVLVVPSDTGLVVYQAWTGSRVPLDRYAYGEYWRDVDMPADRAAMVHELSKRRLTSLTSMTAVAYLMKRPEASATELRLCYGRDLKADQIDAANLILLGASESNPWVRLFEKQSSYVLENGTTGFRILNRSPGKGEPPVYTDLKSSRRVYGILSFLPNGNRGKAVLMIQGSGTAGCEAALKFLFDEPVLEPFLRSIRRGNRIPFFEALVESVNVAGRAPGTHLVAWRLH